MPAKKAVHVFLYQKYQGWLYASPELDDAADLSLVVLALAAVVGFSLSLLQLAFRYERYGWNNTDLAEYRWWGLIAFLGGAILFCFACDSMRTINRRCQCWQATKEWWFDHNPLEAWRRHRHIIRERTRRTHQGGLNKA